MSEGTLSELLQRARGVSPPRDAKARMRARVLAVAVATSAAAGRAAAGTAELAGAGVGKASGQALAYVLAGAAVGLLVLGPLLITDRSPPAEQRGARPAMSSSAPRGAAAGPASTASERAPSQVHAESSSAAAVPRPLPSPAVDPPLPSIDRETALLGEAQRALRRGDSRAALGWLDRYDREFPKGILMEEAAAARAMGACSLPGADHARLLAQFRAHFWGSPLVPRVAAACASGASHDDFDLDSDPPATQDR